MSYPSSLPIFSSFTLHLEKKFRTNLFRFVSLSNTQDSRPSVSQNQLYKIILLILLTFFGTVLSWFSAHVSLTCWVLENPSSSLFSCMGSALGLSAGIDLNIPILGQILIPHRPCQHPHRKCWIVENYRKLFLLSLSAWPYIACFTWLRLS